MTTYNLTVALVAGATTSVDNTDTEALPRFITLVEVREPLKIEITDVRGGL